MNLSKVIVWLRWYAGHAAAVGGLASALALALSGEYVGSWLALLTALSGFGLSIKPGVPTP